MDLSRPEYLWLLAPWCLFVGLGVLGRRRRSRNWSALGQGGPPLDDGRGAVGLAALLLIVGLARPRWGDDPASALPPGRDVVLLIDASRSMGAEDAVPDRLAVAVESARALIRAMAAERGDRVAVVAFAGAGVVRCGLTEDFAAASEVVKSLRPGDVRPGGTDLGSALDVASAAFDDRDHADGRMIVVFTDGEDLAGGWRSRIEGLRREGIVVNALAIGDAESGHPVPSGVGGEPVSVGGKPVLSKRVDEPLEALTGATGGALVRLGLARLDGEALYRDRIAPAARRLRHATDPPGRSERFGVFALAALTVLVVEARPRPSRRPSRRRGVALATTAALGLLIAIGAGPDGESPRRLVERGASAYRERRWGDALDAFEAAAKAAPRSPVPPFGAGAALFAGGRYAEASRAYQKARDLGDEAFRVRVDYALGNAALMADDPAAAIGHYDACIASPRRSRALDAVRRDAEANRDYARRRLRESTPPEPDRDPETNPPDAGGPADAKAPPNGGPDGAGKGEGEGDGPRGPGGAGGSEPDARDKDKGSAEARLETALENVREAREKRPPDVPTRGPAKDDRDW